MNFIDKMINLQYTLLLLIHINDNTVIFQIPEFTIHFATINTFLKKYYIIL